MWCLGLLLPLMIGELFPEGGEHWLNFLRLLTIMDYLFAPLMTAECIDHLKFLIEEHHMTWKEIYSTS